MHTKRWLRARAAVSSSRCRKRNDRRTWLASGIYWLIGPGVRRSMAVMTAILATIGALCAYQSGNSENLALYYKNEAAIKKTEASNQWSYYQAKGEKQNLAELGAALSIGNTDAHAKFVADVEKYT